MSISLVVACTTLLKQTLREKRYTDGQKFLMGAKNNFNEDISEPFASNYV